MHKTQYLLWTFPCFFASTLSCSSSNELPLAIDTPVLHRLTTKQLDRSLAALFHNDALSPLSLPQEIPKERNG